MKNALDTLTQLLHLKDDTKSLRFSDLEEIYDDVWNLGT